jgi:dTDP-4-amino-4,6-dideoxygalactose transaminase
VIPVTKSFLPPQSEFQQILKTAWDKRWITNKGVLLDELEEKLKGFLDVGNLILTTNGTLPIQIAIKALGLSGEIITTPFSYVATTSSIVWENCKPVFVDIDPLQLTIDASLVEAAITKNTTAILATHVFGNICDVDAIQAIAGKYGLKVIYDAAHSFGVKYKGQSALNFGDISTCSFHATKIFHTGEGGCMVTRDRDLHLRLLYHHNFGHKSPTEFHGLGINAKMSELQAAVGLSVLPYWDEILASRKRVHEAYLRNLDLSKMRLPERRAGLEWNYSYFPAIFESEAVLLNLCDKLAEKQIIPRRYFYPSLNTLPYLENKSRMKNSEDIAERILCLPCYHDLTDDQVAMVSGLINEIL